MNPLKLETNRIIPALCRRVQVRRTGTQVHVQHAQSGLAARLWINHREIPGDCAALWVNYVKFFSAYRIARTSPPSIDYSMENPRA